MNDDPVISRIRKARHSISEKCAHDPKKLIAYYMQREKLKNVGDKKREVQKRI